MSSDETTSEDVKRLSRSRVRRCPRNAVVLPSSTISLFTINGGDRSDRVDDIVFNISESDGNGKVILGLMNNHSGTWLSYKVKTTSNQLIRIRPALGILLPEEETTVDLKLRSNAFREDEKNSTNLMIVVMAIIVQDDATDARLAWEEADHIGAAMWKKELPVVLSNGETEKNGFEEEFSKIGLDDTKEE